MKLIKMITFLAFSIILACSGCGQQGSTQGSETGASSSHTVDGSSDDSSDRSATANGDPEESAEGFQLRAAVCSQGNLATLKAEFTPLVGVPAGITAFVPPPSLTPETNSAIALAEASPAAGDLPSAYPGGDLVSVESPERVTASPPGVPVVQRPVASTVDDLENLAPLLTAAELDTAQNFIAKPLTGGQPVTDKTINPYEWAALLVWVRGGDSVPFCSGALVDNHLVLTAAHCAAELQGGDAIFIGGTNFVSDPGELRFVKAIASHQCFSAENQTHDIALVELSAEVDAKPLQLINPDTARDTPPGDALVVAWGKGSPASGIIEVGTLQELTVSLVDQAACSSFYPQNNLTSETVCAGDVGETTCFGDSGSPLAVDHNGELELIGVASLTVSCVEPGVFSRVSAYATWLDGQIEI